MRKDDGMSGNERWEMEQLEAEIQALLQSPVPMEPDFKERLRAELLREHRRFYGKPSLARWRWPFGIVSGTAAAALVLVLAGQLWPAGEPPLHQAEGDNHRNGLVWDQMSPSASNSHRAVPSPSDDGEEPEAFTASEDESSADVPATEPGMLARSGLDSDTSDGREESGRSAGHEEEAVSEKPNGPAVAMDSPKGSTGSNEKSPATDSGPTDVGPVPTQPVREFVFSSSYITMSGVVPYRADTLPAHVELNVDESAFPAEKPIFDIEVQLLPDKQQRQAIAQALGFGHEEQVTAKGFRYRGEDGSTLLFSVEGLPTMEYVYRGELPQGAGNRSRASNSNNGDQDRLWRQQAQAFLKRIGIDVTGMKVQMEVVSGEEDKRIITFIPELAGAPNLAEAVTVHMKQGTVIEAKVPLLSHVPAKQQVAPLVPLSEALQRVVFSEEYFIHPDEKVIIDEAKLVYYAFENGTLAPAYQLRGVEQKSGKFIQLIVSAVTAEKAGN